MAVTVVDNTPSGGAALTDYSVIGDSVTIGGIGSGEAQYVKLLSGAVGSNEVIEGTAANGLEVDVTRVQGTVTVGDGGGSLTVDGSVSISGTPTVTISGAIDTELTTADLDTGAGTDTRAVVGLVRAESGGGALVGSANPLPVVVQTALPAGTNNIGDVDVLTVPAPLNLTGGGVEASALRVTLASDSTGVVSVDDNGGSLTVDGSVSITGTPTVQVNHSLVDNAAFTDGTTRVGLAGFIFDEVAGTALTENDAAAARIDSKRAQVAVIEDETTRGRRVTVTASNALKVDGSAVTQPVSDAGGSLTVDAPVGTPVATRLSDGTSFLTTTGGRLVVDASGIELEVGGPAAADGPVGANPVVVGGRASTAVPTAVSADGDAVHAWYDRRGAQKIVMVDDAGDSAMDGVNDALRVNVVAGGGAGGGTSASDDSVFTPGTTAVTPIGGFADETTPDSVDEGDVGAVRMTLLRALHVNLRDASGNELAVGGGTQYDEDTVAADAEKLTMAGVVRRDTASTLVTADGDRTELIVDASGRLHVNGSGVTQPVSDAGGSLTVDGTVTANAGTGPWPVTDNGGSLTVDGTVSISGTVTVADANLDNATLVDNAAFTDGTTRLMMAGYIFDEVAGTALTENDAAAARIDSKRAQIGIIEDATTRGRWATVTAANALKVDGSAVTQPVSGTVTANAGTGPFPVSDNGGTLTVDQGTAANLKVEPAGAAAHDAAISGATNPIVVGARADTIADAAVGSEVSADDDLTQLRADRDGSLFVQPYGPRQWSYHENSSSALTDATVHAAPGAGLSLYVTDIVVSTGAATALNVFFEEGATTVLGPYYLEAVAGRGFHIRFGVPKKITANTALTITTSAAIAHGIDVTGFIAPG